MKFSIIIPVYNVEEYLNNCIDSIFGQSFNDYEVICVNDGSTDKSAEILTEYASKDSRLSIITQQNKGTAAARNAALKKAKGDYILFLDSDDWYKEDALEILSKNIIDEDFVCFNGQRYYEKQGFETRDNILNESYNTGWEYYNNNALLHRNFAFVCVVLRAYKKDFLIGNKLFFDESNSFEDNLWVPQVCLCAGRIRVISDSLYFYRIREGSKMHNFSLQRKIDLLKVANKLAFFFSVQKGIDNVTIFQAITHHYQVIFCNNNKANDKILINLIDWEAYKIVSRTKLRHRIQYTAMRISPRLFRFVNSL